MTSQLTPSISSSSYKDLNDFLTKHVVKKGDTTKIITNTRIGDKNVDIYGGSYHIPDEEYPSFLNLYNRDVIALKKKEYLTEKQRDSDGPILIDVDLRHSIDIDERQYTKDHIEDLIEIYLDECKNIFQSDETTDFRVFVFEKPTVNQLKEKKITKDGIHILIGLKADHTIQLIMREKVIKKIGEVWTDLNVINTWEDVFDKGISAGTTNWQLYGSRKPNHDKYQLTHVYQVGFDENDGEFTRQEIPLSGFDIGKNIELLSVRHKNNPSLFIKNSFIPIYEEYKKKIGGVSSSSSSGVQRSSFILGGDDNFGSFQIDTTTLSRIKNQEELDAILNRFIDGLGLDEYILREAYEYAMILPASYYGMGSYTKWTRLCWALRNTSSKLLIVFLKVSSKSSTFCYATNVPEICQRWQNTDLRVKNGLTKRSLENWAKTEAKEEYMKVKERSIDTYVENSIQMNCNKNEGSSSCGDFDLANVLYQANKGKYVCASVKTGMWYGIDRHRWKEIDSGTTLRKFISTKMRDLYNNKSIELMKRMNEKNTVLDMVEENGDANDNANNDNSKNKDEEYMKTRSLSILNISQRLARTNDKKNMMTEAKELFYDGDFIQLLDTNPYLICFNNGVFDFKEKVFRDGHPEDYISMSTNINYIKIVPEIHQPIIDEINDFMNKLFPIPDLCRYMWEHLASCLLGTCLNQTFNIYIGVGQNGKSVLINLMEKVLGDYKGDVPLTLVTDKRGKVGGLAPEIVQLKGKRYAVMQEPSKGDKINEGIMKQLTSGKDPIQGRAPYMPQTISFMPQFNLVVTANVLMKIESNDHGTWRRIRAVPFLSLFTENPVPNDPEKPYQFPIDKNIDEKFDSWKEVFASMLVERACKTGGIVKDCDIILEKSAEYRKSQDYISEFMHECLIRNRTGTIKKAELNHEFVLWFSNNYGTKGPCPKDLHEQMNKEYGRQKNAIWYGVEINYAARAKNADNENEDNVTEGEDPDDIDL